VRSISLKPPPIFLSPKGISFSFLGFDKGMIDKEDSGMDQKTVSELIAHMAFSMNLHSSGNG